MTATADPVLLTLEEALTEVPPAPTLVWGAGMAPLTWALSASAPVRYAGLDAGDARGVTVPYEATLDPALGEATRLVCRMPRSKEGLAWILDLASARLPVGGELWLGGHAREGIRSAARPMEERVGPVVTARTKRHGRVLLARRGPGPAREASLDEHVRRFDVPFGPTVLRCVSYPETFAHGRLDEGTRRLLTWLEHAPRGKRILDLGCGAGLIGAALATRDGTQVTLVDASVSATLSARATLAASGLAEHPVLLADADDAPRGPFDLVITNPPFHEGREQDRGIASRFAAAAARRLTGSGRFIAVANRHLGYRDDLSQHFRKVDVAWEDERYRVWCCVGARTA
ncbi:MAG: class I SAM-dependent methyltransferase [Deltaproteobacteria bacterium]|nr:class I SAM-dependent methyltransferase [Deltaproteobacteria bacterium]MCB9785884.1 class I SAM-dependent methyltransferase [Deltaproteobacteria bacterium]